MERKWILPIAIATACAVVTALWGWTARDAAPEHRTGDAPPTIAPARSVAAVAAAAVPATPEFLPPPLPSPREPLAPGHDSPTATPPRLRDEIAELDRRARSGDAAAACRLAGELLACERARLLQPYTGNLEAQTRHLAQRGARPEDVDRQIDDALRRQAENADALARCEGVDDRRWPPAARYFGLAAEAGHRPSMVQFLGADRYRADQLFRDPELIPLLRANGPRYFRMLVEAGDLELLQRWAMSPGLPHDVLFEVLPPPWNDPGLAAAMQRQSMLARGIAPPDVPVLHEPTPAQMEQARDLFTRHFAARVAEHDAMRQRGAGSPYDLSQYRCDDAGS